MVSRLREEGLEPGHPGSWQRQDSRIKDWGRAGPPLPQAPFPHRTPPPRSSCRGFLLPFPVPHPVLGAGAERKGWEPGPRSSGVRNRPGRRSQGPLGAAGTRSRVRAGDPGVPIPPSSDPGVGPQPLPTPHPGVQAPLPLLYPDSGPEPRRPLPAPSEPRRPSGRPHHSGPQELGPRPSLPRAMLSGERKEGGSPRFGKLHLPVGLWINSPRKQLAKLGRRWPSAASVK